MIHYLLSLIALLFDGGCSGCIFLIIGFIIISIIAKITGWDL